jgi:beta-N-acetylhexosaminidase
VIGNRGFHSDPAVVCALAGAYIDGMAEAGMAATGKHFPGHGWVEADSHVAIPVDERAGAELLEVDLMPFKVLAPKLRGIMPAHVIYRHFDANPAGFSTFWLQDVLRQQLGFGGVIFSDDLAMEGASVVGGYVERAQAALNAGCDMALVCNQRAGAIEVLNWLQTQPTASNARIAALRGEPAPGLDALRETDRWQQVQLAMAEAMKNS